MGRAGAGGLLDVVGTERKVDGSDEQKKCGRGAAPRTSTEIRVTETVREHYRDTTGERFRRVVRGEAKPPVTVLQHHFAAFAAEDRRKGSNAGKRRAMKIAKAIVESIERHWRDVPATQSGEFPDPTVTV